ncbi:hypothetical protein GCM10022226_21950 [Sphaerisporangium flaviroseum]|uniref:Uncharacterized protein n=1 Tax=Sphaerisporangium flaviroseum TaxID=509199 RepID=A0ABP7HQA7_9ACTN
MEMLLILTVSAPAAEGGMRQFTLSRLVVAKAGTTRAEMYNWARAQCPEGLREANTLFFSVEPNAIPVPVEAVTGR